MISIILPVHNEVASLWDVYSSLKRTMAGLGKPYEIIFVNDASTDGSSKVLTSIRSSDNSVKLINFEKRYGQSNALQAGFDNSKGDILITLDSDMETDPSDIPGLLRKLDEGYDVVCGDRLLRPPTLNEFLSRFGNAVFRFFFRTHLTDMTCTFRVYKREAIDGLVIRGNLHRYLPVLLQMRGAKTAEIYIKYTQRKRGRSKNSVLARIFSTFENLFMLLFFRKHIMNNTKRGYIIKEVW